MASGTRAAALILAVVMVAIGMSRVTNTKMLGLGIALAVLMDAVVVRSLLLPAVMRLTGRATWWAPGPLRRLPALAYAPLSKCVPAVHWQDVVEGSFEVQRRDGDALLAHNLIDDLVYRVYSNMGRSAFSELRRGMFVIGRIVPLHPGVDAWLVSGHLAAYPKSAGPTLAQIAADAATTDPELAFRNPEKIERAWQMQAEDRADFIAYFGSDL